MTSFGCCSYGSGCCGGSCYYDWCCGCWYGLSWCCKIDLIEWKMIDLNERKKSFFVCFESWKLWKEDWRWINQSYSAILTSYQVWVLGMYQYLVNQYQQERGRRLNKIPRIMVKNELVNTPSQQKMKLLIFTICRLSSVLTFSPQITANFCGLSKC